MCKLSLLFRLVCLSSFDIRRYLLICVNGILLPHGLGNLSNDERLVNVLIYGYESLSFELNAKILSATLEYM